jgi:hypothetical protein
MEKIKFILVPEMDPESPSGGSSKYINEMYVRYVNQVQKKTVQ